MLTVEIECDQAAPDSMELFVEDGSINFTIYDGSGYAQLLLTDREKVEVLRDALTEWLER